MSPKLCQDENVRKRDLIIILITWFVSFFNLIRATSVFVVAAVIALMVLQLFSSIIPVISFVSISSIW